MTRFGQRDERSRLEELLRRDRPRPPRALEELLTLYVAYRPPERPLAARLAVAAALSLAMIAALGSLVGVGQAASGPRHAVRAVVHVFRVASPAPASAVPAASAPAGAAPKSIAVFSSSAKDDQTDEDDDPAHDQYKPGKGCGDKNHVHAKENECKKLK